MRTKIVSYCFFGLFLAGIIPQANSSDSPKLPDPRWRIQVVIYPQTHMIWSDAAGDHDVTTEMTSQEIALAVSASNRFYSADVPALDSGLMIPLPTVIVKQTPLTRFAAPVCFWPDPGLIAPDLDPLRYDSAVIIWKDDGWDAVQRRFVSLACYGGLTWPRGTGQTFTSFLMKMIPPDQRNVFKHEWGHAILFYYDTSGAAPKPAVNNHINDTDTRYVSCHSAQPYFLIDETDGNPIPYSIYNDQTGFTHDYYSGVTATPDQPDRCLGITPAAWATGGPVTHPIQNPGDLNGDSKVDRTDLALLMSAIGTATLPNDPRDLDYDGWITVLDARRLVTFCTKPACAP